MTSCVLMPCAQPRFRSMWERYCRGVQAVVYVVDAADHEALDNARAELHELLSKPSLSGAPCQTVARGQG